MTNPIEMHAIASGHVQGVSFRYTTLSHAKQLHIVGTVRNLSDGTVEIVAQGTKEHLDTFLHLLKTDSGAAKVAAIQAEFYSIIEPFSVFKIDQ